MTDVWSWIVPYVSTRGRFFLTWHVIYPDPGLARETLFALFVSSMNGFPVHSLEHFLSDILAYSDGAVRSFYDPRSATSALVYIKDFILCF